ncbi:peptidyl-prolyl cis-trans isomerase [Qipengyuania oceanensis]|uniref:Parvulin-like PPIase n=1 Tax=Qipengyuania oceanensis TaxID=1463597 RepID=A0A844YFG6_9SPHN|nr:peptidyl-prolyl cis-trans isomerase [Qipengyuania oceanensis]
MHRPSWTREPLVHFLFGGALLFAFFAWRGEEADPASRTIAVGRAEQAALAQRFEATMRRPPTDAELDTLVDQYVREEVLYREALRLGLDRDDAVVRRRLAQKMDEIAGARAETAPLDDAVLRKWLATHPERFASDTAFTFDQLWFENRDDADTALAKLRAGADWEKLGQTIDLPRTVEARPARDVASRYGTEFLAALRSGKADGRWSGPIRSGFGWHLVRLEEAAIGAVPSFEDLRADVENDWRSSTISQRREDAYRVLRDGYTVTVAE